MSLGENIAHLRRLKKLTRPDVARGIGIEDQQPIYALETRKSTRSEFAPALAKFFGVELNVLVTEDLTGLTLEQIEAMSRPSHARDRRASTADSATAKANAEIAFSKKLARLIDLFANSTDDGRDQIIMMAENAEKLPESRPSAANDHS